MHRPMNPRTRKLFRRLNRLRPNASGVHLREYARKADLLGDAAMRVIESLSDKDLGIDFDTYWKAR